MLQLSGVGLAVTVALYAAFSLVPFSGNPQGAMMLLGLVSAVVCPPSLALVSPLDIYEPPYGVGGPVQWLFIGIINSANYAIVGYITTRLLSRANRPTAG
jgi:hypothetical protein